MNAHFPNAGLLFLRLVAGLSLGLAHGLGKIPPSEKFIQGVTSLGFPLPTFFAWSAGLSEFLGALLIAAGLFTRPAAAFVAITMGVALFVAHAADPFKSRELALLYFTAAGTIFLTGPGAWSLDARLKGLRRRKK